MISKGLKKNQSKIIAFCLTSALNSDNYMNPRLSDFTGHKIVEQKKGELRKPFNKTVCKSLLNKN